MGTKILDEARGVRFGRGVSVSPLRRSNPVKLADQVLSRHLLDPRHSPTTLLRLRVAADQGDLDENAAQTARRKPTSQRSRLPSMLLTETPFASRESMVRAASNGALIRCCVTKASSLTPLF